MLIRVARDDAAVGLKAAVTGQGILRSEAFQADSGFLTKRPFLRPVRDVLRDRNDLKVLTGCADFIPQQPSVPCLRRGIESLNTTWVPAFRLIAGPVRMPE